MTPDNSVAASAHHMPANSAFDSLADELGAIAGRIEREAQLRIAGALAVLERTEAERTLRIET